MAEARSFQGKRARRAEEKAARRADILRVAERMFASEPYESITVARLAREAGIGKGTVYLYFPTKEALFLTLVGEKLQAWLQEVLRQLEAHEGPVEHAVVEVLTLSLAERPHLLALLSMVHSILERNVEVRMVLGFKMGLIEALGPVARWLDDAMPAFSEGDGMTFLLWAHSAMVGMFQAFAPGGNAALALQDPRVAVLARDPLVALQSALAAWLRGWKTTGAVVGEG